MSENMETSFEDLLGRLRRQSTMTSQQSGGSPASHHSHGSSHFPPPPYNSEPNGTTVSSVPQEYQQQQHSQSISGIPPVPESSYFPEYHHPPAAPEQETLQHAPSQSSGIQPASVLPSYMSSMPPPMEGHGVSRTASLLQLLKFAQAAPPPMVDHPEPIFSPPPPPAVISPLTISQQQAPPHNRTFSASDLVASVMNRPGSVSSQRDKSGTPDIAAPPVASETARQQTPINQEEIVLDLFNRTKPPQERSSSRSASLNQPEAESSITGPGEEGVSEPAPVENVTQEPIPQGLDSSSPYPDSRPMSVPPASASPGPPRPQPSPAHAQTFTTPAKGLFTYVNPFEQLHATSPRHRTPRASTPVPGAGKRSGLSTGEIKAENIPLPFSPSASAPPSATPSENSILAPVEPEPVKEVSTMEEVQQKEDELLEKVVEQLQDFSKESGDDVAPEPVEAQDIVEQSLDGEEETKQTESAQPAESTETAEIAEAAGKEQSDAVPSHNGKEDLEDEEEAYESASESQESIPVKVYNFPMKPFSSITIIPSAIQRPKFPSNKISDIVRMSRTFDQLDRNLITASNQFIVYAIHKSNGRSGIRVLRQYDGKDKVLMKDSTDRTFNVAIGKGERVLGTGISGAVLWADVNEIFETSDWSNQMFIFPPSEEQGQSNGVLKSRARKTSRQSDVFAIGRGKTISIIHAPTAKAYAQGRAGNEVDSKRYLLDHARTIDTGKASKDFAFSDDDSVIISIDKAGKLKLWDVQELINFSENEAYNTENRAPRQLPMVLSAPSLVFSAVGAGETYRATSVMFLDKFRPYHKCTALRYVVVGMKQNHTLQLWDLALGRPVQEINFPQESDTDALCSVVYHPLTGIIVVGNPTRNSIYFIHLSAPKYFLPPLSQAQYIRALAAKDPSVPKPDATAILSGLREYSFESKGQLISLDILDPVESDDTLFELYVAHSKGMTTLSVHKEDLGWEVDNRVKLPVDAIKERICTLQPMPPPPPPETEKDSKSETTDSTSSQMKPIPSESAPKSATKSRSVSPRNRVVEKGEGVEEARPALNGSGSRKKKKDKVIANFVSPGPSFEEPRPERSTTQKTRTNGAGAMSAPQPLDGGADQPGPVNVPAAIPLVNLDREVKKFEKTVSTEFSRVITRELEQLYRRIDEDRRIQQAAGEAKHEAVLRLLSSTLTDNVEQVISRIVMSNIEGTVVPAIADVATVALDRKLGEALSRSLSVTVPAELRSSVPDIIKRTLSHPELLGKISEAVTKPIAHAVEREFVRTLQNTIIPTFQQMALEAAQKVAIETEQKQNETIAALERLHNADSKKIDQLVAAVKSMSVNITSMARAQQEFQEQVQRAQAEYVQAYEEGNTPEAPAQAPPPPPPPPPPPKTEAELEAEEIENLLRNGRYEDGTIKWLQSKDRQAELFDELMVRYRFDFKPNLSQLVLLSVSAAVSVRFENKVMDRLSWLEGVLAVLDPMDPEIREICHRIMQVVVQRLEQLYMGIAERNMNVNDPILRRIAPIARRARELSALTISG
ncbi:hypothetical protein RUND412_001887 [Rhizina undulata]